MMSIYDVLFFAFFVACFSIFLNYCYGTIFSPYLVLIRRLPDWLYYPLGGCLYCHGTWIAILFCFHRLEWRLDNIIIGLCFLGVNFVFTALLNLKLKDVLWQEDEV